MKSFLRNSYFIILLSVLVKSVVIAQVNSYPVNGIVKVALPASISFEEYVNPITSPIDLVISMNDQRFPVRSVFLSLRMEGPAGTVASFNNRVSYQLIAGNNFIPKAVVASCFSLDNLNNPPSAYLDKAMPAGIYTFSFTVTDALTGAVLSLPISSAPVWIEASDPPVPVAPTNYSGVPATQVQNVIFQWLPRHTPNPNIEYEFTLTELPIANRGNLQNVFMSQPPLCKITTPIPTLLYDAKYPPMRAGAVYAWRVQAKPKFGIAPGKTSAFLNEGYSEIYSFLYEKRNTKLNPPTNLYVAWAPDYNRINFDWEGEDNHVKYIVTTFIEQDIYSNEPYNITDENGNSVKNPKYGGVIGTQYVDLRQTRIGARGDELGEFEVEKGVDNKVEHVRRISTNAVELRMKRDYYTKHNLKFSVIAVDVFGRESEPVSYVVKPIDGVIFDDQQQKIITLNGTVEGVIRDLIVPRNRRTYSLYQDIQVKGEKERYKIKDANVCFYLSNDEITDKYLNEFQKNKNHQLIACSKTTSEGAYTIASDKLTPSLLAKYKNYYLLIKSPSIKFANHIIPIDIPDQGGKAERTLATQTIIDNSLLPNLSLQYPKICDDLWDWNNYEFINLYRPRSVFQDSENYPFLKHEAGINASTEVIFNKIAYTKICDLKESRNTGETSGPRLLQNGYDSSTEEFLVQVKEYGKKESVFIPTQIKNPHWLSNVFIIGTKSPNTLPNVAMGAFYDAPLVKITGSITSAGKPIPDLEVGIFIPEDDRDFRIISMQGRSKAPNCYETIYWQKVTADVNGNYEMKIPHEIVYNKNLKNLIIFNKTPGVFGVFQAKNIPKPRKDTIVNIELRSKGSVIASVILNQNGEPVVDAKIIHSSGAMATTNRYGEFALFIPYSPLIESDPKVKFLAGGYFSQDIDISTFQKEEHPDEIEDITDFGLAFWTQQVEELRDLTDYDFETLKVGLFYKRFVDNKVTLTSFYIKDSVGVISTKYAVKISTYVLNDNAEKEYVSSSVSLPFEEEALDIPSGGIVSQLQLDGEVLTGTIVNKNSDANIRYAEENFSIRFDLPANKRDTVKVEILLKPGILVAGVVTAYETDSTKMGPEAGVSISVKGMDDIESDEEGRFRIWLEKDAEEVELRLKKDGFNELKIAFTTKTKTKEELIRDFVNDKKNDFNFVTLEELQNLQLGIYNRDDRVPEFKTLQGFKVNIESINAIDDKTFSMSGSIDVSEEEGIYKLLEGEELTFQNAEVEEDDYDPTNAVLRYEKLNLEQETLNLMLFDYAKVESNNENNGYANHIKLEKLKLDGRESFGKIGGVQVKFKPEKIMKKDVAPILQEFNLVPDVPEEQQEVSLNNDITKQNQAKLDKEQELEQAKNKQSSNSTKPAAKTGTKTTKPAATTGTKATKPAANTGTKATKPAAKTETKATKPAATTGTKATEPAAEEEKKVEEGKKEPSKYEGKESTAKIIPVFVSGGKALANFNEDLEFNLQFPEDVDGVPRKDEKDDQGKPTGKKEKIGLPLGLGFKVLLNDDKPATLSKDGVKFEEGNLGFPMMAKIGIEGKMPLVEMLFLAPSEKLPVRELRFAKAKASDNAQKTAAPDNAQKTATPDSAKKATTAGSAKKATTAGSTKKVTTAGSAKKATTAGSAKKAAVPDSAKKVTTPDIAKKAAPDSAKKAAKEDPYFVRIGVDKKWRFEVDKIDVFDDFTNAGFGGKLYTDQNNHLIVHAMAIRKANGETYPYFDMEFPENGFKINQLVLKSPKDQHILSQYNYEDKAYEVDAGVRMETPKNATSTFLKTVLPLEIERFIYNTSGKFYLAVKVGRSLKLGPVTINIRKVIFNKGGAVTWDEMSQSLQRDSTESAQLNQTQKFNNTNFRHVKDSSTIARNSYIDLAPEEEDVEIEKEEVKWAFGLAGGVAFESLKGATTQKKDGTKFKSDASFIIGERENGLEFKFNSIDIVIESSGFKGAFSLELETGGDRIGFQAKGEVETMLTKLAATLKYYKIPNGIEFGISVVKSTRIVTGPITWTSIGGGIDLNTATNKYMVYFLGSAHPSQSTPEVTDFRNIRVEILFALDECGIKPVITGTTDLFLKQKQVCKIELQLDFCKLFVYGNLDCTTDIMGGQAQVKAALLITSYSFFMGANVKMKVLGMNANAVFVIGVNTAFTGKDVPYGVRQFKEFIPDRYLNNEKLNGIFVGCTLDYLLETGVNLAVFEIGFKVVFKNETELYFSFDNANFLVRNDFQLSIALNVSAGFCPVCVSASAQLGLRLLVEGGRNDVNGWFLRGEAAASLELMLGVGSKDDKINCGDFVVKMFAAYGKFCLDKSIKISFVEKGKGWDVSL